MDDLSKIPRDKLETVVFSCLKEIKATGERECQWYSTPDDYKKIMMFAEEIGFELD